MSMTILSAPAVDSPVGNDMNFVIDSSNKTQPNYKYILDVYIGATKVATIKNRPNPVFSNYGIFNINKTLQNFFDGKYFVPGVTTTPNPISGNVVAYSVRLSESYGTGTLNIDVVTDTAKNAYYAALPALDFYTQSYSNYLNKFQTNRPRGRVIPVDESDNFFLTVFRASASPVDSLVITQYDASGAVVGSPSTIALTAHCMLNLRPSLLPLGVGVVSYKVELKASSVVTDTLNFSLNAVSPYPVFPVHFLNRLGGYESAHFRLTNKRTIEIEKKEMREIGYKLGASNTIDYSDANRVMYESDRMFAATYRESIEADYEFLNDDEADWIIELATSGAMWTEKIVGANTFYVPVKCTDKKAKRINRLMDGIQNVTMNFDFGQLNNVQLR